MSNNDALWQGRSDYDYETDPNNPNAEDLGV